MSSGSDMRKRAGLILSVLLLAPGGPRQETALERCALAVREGRWIDVDISILKKDTAVHSARLVLPRDPVDGTMDEARVDVEVFDGDEAAGRPLRLLPPGYDCFDATEAVRRWLRDPSAGRRFLVKACPRWRSGETHLDVCYRGRSADPPRQAAGLKVLHRAGQSFITWQEIEPREPGGEVRYRVYRHTRPITAATVAEAQCLGEAGPSSACNTRGRSVDELISRVRKRAVVDDELAKKLARTDYFSRCSPDMPEMAEVPAGRFAIEDDKPLPPGTGLFVHHPAQAGEACYAVAACEDGVANLRDFSGTNSLEAPVRETAGFGVPVRQGSPELSVFFDYPGTRWRYVQWASPPLAHLPGTYFNWGVFVPRGWEAAPARRLSIFFHDATQRYLKPPWPHRQDTVILSPHDAPYRSYGYGHHESLGTLRSFRQGRVQPFFARRVDAMLDWAVKEFGADPARISCGGHGTWGGTAALQYGLRRPGRIAWVMADQSPDPDPRQTPPEIKYYGRADERPVKTHLAAMEAVWGRVEWGVPGEGEKSIWEEMDLPALVRAEPSRTMPFLALGAGSQHVTWKQETDLLKAYLETWNGFMAEFFWGSSEVLPLPIGPFEPRLDRPILACKPKSPLFPDFMRSKFDTGERGYAGGSRLNTVPRWLSEDAVDEPRRLEITVYAASDVAYSGSATKDATVRNAKQFRPAPGEKVTWRLADGPAKAAGEVQADGHGFVTIPDLKFGRPARLSVQRTAP